MPTYTKDEARDWAWENMRGVTNVIIPSYTSDLSAINEPAIRHDVQRDIELGFWGALLVAETALTVDELVQFTEIAADEAAGRLRLVHHATWNTLEENIEAARRASTAGAELVLLSYPSNFYPLTSRDIYDYTKSFCDATDLAVVLFPVPLWGFDRLHPASIDPAVCVELVEDVPNIVAIKAEGGHPSLGGFTHIHHLLGDKVIVEHPLEEYAIPLATMVPIQWIGTSCGEFYGPAVPKMLDLVNAGKIDEAMEWYWRIDPARKAANELGVPSGANFIHRMVWKYMAWLQGFNGGPLRQPTMRISQGQMTKLRGALEKSGFDVPTETDDQFFIGRNPL
jgi:4-hydroxy-tetrahydrodipicolinate synthase